MADNITDKLRGLIFSASDLANFGVFPQPFIEDYLTIIENLVLLAGGVDDSASDIESNRLSIEENKQLVESITSQVRTLTAFTATLAKTLKSQDGEARDYLQLLHAIESAVSSVNAWAFNINQKTNKTTGEQGVIQLFYDGNVLSGFSGGGFQRVDLSLGATINPPATSYPYSARTKSIDDIVDSTENTLKYNTALKQEHIFRILFDYSNKETNRNYNAVWKVKYPDGADPFFTESYYVTLPRKNDALTGLVAVFLTLSTEDNITENLELHVAIQNADEADAGQTTGTNIIIESITAFYGAVSGAE